MPTMTTMAQAAQQQRPAADSQVPLFAIRNIAKAYGHVKAVQDVSFGVYPREVVGLLGDNGAGKSTIIKILSGIVEPDSGTFLREGREVEVNCRMAARLQRAAPALKARMADAIRVQQEDRRIQHRR